MKPRHGWIVLDSNHWPPPYKGVALLPKAPSPAYSVTRNYWTHNKIEPAHPLAKPTISYRWRLFHQRSIFERAASTQ
jgi:hypothetical protein